MGRGWIAALIVVALTGCSPSDEGEVTASRSSGPVDGIDETLTGLMDRDRQGLAEAGADRLVQLTDRVGAPALYTSQVVDALSPGRGGADWECLTEALYFEARGEEIVGQFAVAEVILNRVDSARYPDRICAVVAEGTGARDACQFSYTCDGLPELVEDRAAWDRLGRIAQAMLDGAPRVLTGGATHYHTVAVDPHWNDVYPQTAAIGAHLFYRQEY